MRIREHYTQRHRECLEYQPHLYQLTTKIAAAAQQTASLVFFRPGQALRYKGVKYSRNSQAEVSELAERRFPDVVELPPTLPLLLEAEFPSAPVLGTNEPIFVPRRRSEKQTKSQGQQSSGSRGNSTGLRHYAICERTREQPVRGVGAATARGSTTTRYRTQCVCWQWTGGGDRPADASRRYVTVGRPDRCRSV